MALQREMTGKETKSDIHSFHNFGSLVKKSQNAKIWGVLFVFQKEAIGLITIKLQQFLAEGSR